MSVKKITLAFFWIVAWMTSAQALWVVLMLVAPKGGLTYLSEVDACQWLIFGVLLVIMLGLAKRGFSNETKVFHKVKWWLLFLVLQPCLFFFLVDTTPPTVKGEGEIEKYIKMN